MLVALLLALLPAHLDLGPPFPPVAFDAPTIETIAPGVEYGEYDLVTGEGPIVVHVIAVAPHAPGIELNTVLADDALTSPGETVSSMAQRTGAIAGINGDYFDIGNTNAPTNVVVHDDELLRTPDRRYALLVTQDGTPQISQVEFAGTLQLADRTVTLDAVNEFPPPGGGVSLLTPAFGPVPPNDDLTLVALDPTDGTPPFATYRVTTVPDNTVRQPPGYYVAIGMNAYAAAGVPNVGDTIAAHGDLSPVALGDLVAAVGGGPLILDNGAWVDDPNGPSGGEFDRPIPCSGAAIGADGTLYLLEVDGRQPELSVGITRPEFAALMLAFGAVRGMAFDGGGSSELVARIPADSDAQLVNTPSDGHERKVADGLFVYDTAPVGPATQLLVQPVAVRALRGASINVRFAAADSADHVVADALPIDVRVEPSGLGTYRQGTFTAAASGEGSLVAREGAMMLRVPIRVYDDPARVAILPEDPSVAQNGRLTLQARAYDAQGYAIALPATLPWRAQNASIDGGGTLTAGVSDALVSLLLGDHLANAHVTVGFHDVALPTTPSFMTQPKGGEGSVQPVPGCEDCAQLQYALGPGERAAYLVTGVTLPARSVGIAFDVDDDGQGALLKLALRNAINEEVLLPVAPMDHPGWREVAVRLPQGLAQPARLVAIYVIGANASATIQGTITVKNLHAVVAGSGPNRP
ncbi:MAG TPA: phosphodiester glycosidase family protein [Candidatus Baltobacteraceae bacterium]|nr:phosphodiester glycosidase family protein [Candidatus Baltobacteraceae bacterium]